MRERWFTGPRGPVVSTLSFNLSAESRGAGSILAVCPGRYVYLSCAVKFLVTILYGVVIFNLVGCLQCDGTYK